MSIERTREVMEKYWASEHSDTSMMADDVTFTVMANGQEARGPDGVLQLLNYFYIKPSMPRLKPPLPLLTGGMLP